MRRTIVVTFLCVSSSRSLTEEKRNNSFVEERSWIQVRTTILRVLAAAINLSQPSVKRQAPLQNSNKQNSEAKNRQNNKRNKGKGGNEATKPSSTESVDDQPSKEPSTNGNTTRQYHADVMESISAEYLELVTKCQQCTRNQVCYFIFSSSGVILTTSKQLFVHDILTTITNKETFL